jgi:hypothetical protein
MHGAGFKESKSMKRRNVLSILGGMPLAATFSAPTRAQTVKRL